MELGDIRSVILSTPLVKNLHDDMRPRFVMMLLHLSETKEMSRGDVLFLKGDRETDTGCLILQGEVEVQREGKGIFVEAPEIIGEMHLFTPEGERTATVEVTVGGLRLEFEWGALGSLARQFYSPEELDILKKAIVGYAWKRDASLFAKHQ